MIKVTYEINKNGIRITTEAEYGTYEELNAERNNIVNGSIFAYNDLLKKTGTVNQPAAEKPLKKAISQTVDGPATEKQWAFLERLGYEYRAGDEDMTYSQANNLIRQLKNCQN